MAFQRLDNGGFIERTQRQVVVLDDDRLLIMRLGNALVGHRGTRDLIIQLVILQWVFLKRHTVGFGHCAVGQMVHNRFQLRNLTLQFCDEFEKYLALETLIAVSLRADQSRQVRARWGNQIWLQRRRIHRPVFLQNGNLLGHILELTDIAGPAVVLEFLHCIVGQRKHRTMILGGKIAGELHEKRIDILPALAQGRQMDNDRAETVIEVLAELALRDAVCNVHVGGRHHTHIRPLYLGRSHADKFTVLQHTEQTHLGCQRKVCHLIQENRATVSILEIALATIHCSGERPLLMTKKFRVYGAFRNCAAVHRNVLALFTAAIIMDDFGEILLAHTALADHQNRQVGGSHLHGNVNGPLQGRVKAYDVITALDGIKVGTHKQFSYMGRKNTKKKHTFAPLNYSNLLQCIG